VLVLAPPGAAFAALLEVMFAARAVPAVPAGPALRELPEPLAIAPARKATARPQSPTPKTRQSVCWALPRGYQNRFSRGAIGRGKFSENESRRKSEARKRLTIQGALLQLGHCKFEVSRQRQQRLGRSLETREFPKQPRGLSSLMTSLRLAR
jgi:hypothetical protein